MIKFGLMTLFHNTGFGQNSNESSLRPTLTLRFQLEIVDSICQKLTNSLEDGNGNESGAWQFDDK